MKPTSVQRLLIISLVFNLLFFLAGGIYGFRKLNSGGAGFTYYEAYVSTFALSKVQAEIVFVGDSITLGGMWQEFFPETRVLNRGIGSDTSEGVLNRMDEVLSRNPKKIFLMVGINDLAKKIPIQDTLRNYDGILEEIRKTAPECAVYLQSVLPCGSIKNESIESLNAELRGLSERHGCYYLDIYSLFLDAKGIQRQECFAADKVHLNGNGYKVWIDFIAPLVR